MQVVDTERSENGPQRRKSAGRLLHCCCICGRLDVWGESWSAFYSYKDLDDCEPIPKCCSEGCRKKAGPRSKNVSAAMIAIAHAAEMREPNIVFREADANPPHLPGMEERDGLERLSTRVAPAPSQTEET